MTVIMPPLFEKDPNIVEGEASARKRSHDEYAGDAVKTEGQESHKNSSESTSRPTDASSMVYPLA